VRWPPHEVNYISRRDQNRHQQEKWSKNLIHTGITNKLTLNKQQDTGHQQQQLWLWPTTLVHWVPDILSFCWSAEVTWGPRDDAGWHAKQRGGGEGHKRKEWTKRKPEQGKPEKEEEDEQKLKTWRSTAKTKLWHLTFLQLSACSGQNTTQITAVMNTGRPPSHPKWKGKKKSTLAKACAMRPSLWTTGTALL